MLSLQRIRSSDAFFVPAILPGWISAPTRAGLMLEGMLSGSRLGGAPGTVPTPLDSSTSSSAQATDAQLVQQTLSGSDKAAEQLYRRHASMAFGLAHRILGGPEHEVDDVVQDAYVSAFDGLARLQDPQSFAKWLGTIVVRTAQRRIKRKALTRKLGLSRSEATDLDALVSSDATPEKRAELTELYRILESLPADVRVAFVLRKVERLSISEIAEQTELSPATVKRRIKSAEALLEQRRQGR